MLYKIQFKRGFINSLVSDDSGYQVIIDNREFKNANGQPLFSSVRGAKSSISHALRRKIVYYYMDLYRKLDKHPTNNAYRDNYSRCQEIAKVQIKDILENQTDTKPGKLIYIKKVK